MTNERSGTAYLVVPEDRPGPGVLVLHSWWGLTPGVKAVTEALADEGFSAVAPSLLGRALPADADAARSVLADASPDAMTGLILDTVVALRAHSADPDAPVGVIGYSMGASLALWLGTKAPDSVAAVVANYGTQDMDFTDLSAPVLCHLAASDPLVTEDQVVEMQAHLLLLDTSVEVHRHEGTRHFFAEDGVPVLGADGTPGERDDVEREAAQRAWLRSTEFLHEHLDRFR
jgi:carboxymethylenebutenolidase